MSIQRPVPALLPLPPRGEAPLDPLRTIDQATQRVESANLDLKGIKTVRVLNESRFLAVLERMVEERLRVRLGAGAKGPAERPEPSAGGQGRAPSAGLREEYRRRWDEFRRRFEEKLRSLEGRAEALARAHEQPAR
jgi:hypothetical protein